MLNYTLKYYISTYKELRRFILKNLISAYHKLPFLLDKFPFSVSTFFPSLYIHVKTAFSTEKIITWLTITFSFYLKCFHSRSFSNIFQVEIVVFDETTNVSKIKLLLLKKISGIHSIF